MEFDLGATLTWLDQHDAAHPKPVNNCAHCARPQSPESTVKAELVESLGRGPTRVEVAADPRMIAFDAQRRYELMIVSAQCGVQPKQ